MRLEMEEWLRQSAAGLYERGGMLALYPFSL